MEGWWWVLSALVLVVTAVWWRQSRAAHMRRATGTNRDRTGRR